jgi:hypothetical protein
LSAEKLPLEDARVSGFEDIECECEVRTAWPSSWSSGIRSWLVEVVTAERPEAGRGEVAEEDEVGAEGRRREEA